MKIESPLYALNSLAQTQKALDRALQRLSSGQRINSASDDPAGLSIANGLESQMRGISQGILNINESFGFLATAEGSIATQVQITQRMRELAVTASTGTLSKTDRSYLNVEFQQLLSEFDRIAEQTNYNGTKLLDGTFATSNIQVGAYAQQVIPFSLGNLLSNQVFPTDTLQTTTTTTATNVGTGTFQNPATFATGATPLWLASGDFNGDGKVDILTANQNGPSVSLLKGNGDGTFQAKVDTGTASNAYAVTVGDLNNDGKLDYVVSEHDANQIEIFCGNGNGTFQAGVVKATGNGPQQAVIADINGDGKADIVTADSGGTDLSVFLGNGDGTYQARKNIGVNGRSVTDVALVDLNNDGILDAVAVSTQQDIEVLQGNGDGTFKAPSEINNPVNTSNITVGDFNGDGKMDFVTEDTSGNTVRLYLGNGNFTFAAPSTITTGTNPVNPIAADINGDGKLDLITADYGSGTISIFIGNGNGTFKARTTKSLTDASHLIYQDINGDGVGDLVVSDDTNSKIYSYLQNTTTQNQSTTTTTGSILPFDITTQTNASNLLAVIDSALTNLNAQRSNIGAYQSRLESALSVNQITLQNISQARSQIMDTDIASATSELVKNQILQQAGVSVLAQADIENKRILDLLNF